MEMDSKYSNKMLISFSNWLIVFTDVLKNMDIDDCITRKQLHYGKMQQSYEDYTLCTKINEMHLITFQY